MKHSSRSSYGYLFLVVRLIFLPMRGHSYCDYFKYHPPGRTNCVMCAKCPPGQEVTNHCGYTEHGQTRPACKPCVKGQTFSGEYSIDCEQCQVYCPEGMRVVKECTLTNDTKCARKCPMGYFANSEGRCSKCSYCCGDDWQRNNIAQKECLEAGMGRCSCAPRKDCKQSQGTCLLPTHSPLNATNKTTSQRDNVLAKNPKKKCIRQLRLLQKCRRKKQFKKCIHKAKQQYTCRGKGRSLRKCLRKRKRICRKKLRQARKCRQHHKNKRVITNVSTRLKKKKVEAIIAGRKY